MFSESEIEVCLKYERLLKIPYIYVFQCIRLCIHIRRPIFRIIEGYGLLQDFT